MKKHRERTKLFKEFLIEKDLFVAYCCAIAKYSNHSFTEKMKSLHIYRAESFLVGSFVWGDNWRGHKFWRELETEFKRRI